MWWLAIFIALLTCSPAIAGEGLIKGLSEDDLLSCGLFFIDRTQRDGKTFYRFAQTLTAQGTSRAIPASLFLGEHPDGCEASVGIEDGKVATMETKQFSGSLLACFACLRIFSECKYLRR